MCTGRTGSTLLQQTLHNKPQIHMGGELVGDYHVEEGCKGPQKPLEKTIEDHFTAERFSYTKAVGFKAFYHSLDILKTFDGESLGNLLKKLGIKVIHLERKNLLRILLSEHLARINNDFHYKIYEKNKVTLSHKKCLSFFVPQKRIKDKYRNFFKDTFKVTYTEIATDLLGTVQKIESFLGVDKRSSINNTKQQLPIKQNVWSLSECIENFDELKEVFIGTEWEWFFNE